MFVLWITCAWNPPGVLKFCFEQRERGREAPPADSVRSGRGELPHILPVASVGRSIASLLLTIDTAPTDRQGVTPRRYIAVGVPPRYFRLASSHAPALGCWDGSGTCRRIISGVLLVPSFPIFCSSSSGLFFPYASPGATIATGGTYDIAASPRDCPGVRITPPPSSARAYAGKSRKGAKCPQDLPLRDFSAYAIPYYQGVIRTPRRACPGVAFHFR